MVSVPVFTVNSAVRFPPVGDACTAFLTDALTVFFFAADFVTAFFFAAFAMAQKSAEDIRRITIRTHEAAIRIIDKKGPLNNPADRDHCIQYMVAVPLLFGRLTAADYEDSVAADPRIDSLCDRITCVEDPQFTRDYHDPDKRSIANGLTVELNDGTKLPEVVVEYPIGHRRRRQEGMPVLVEKFRTNLARRFPPKQQKAILDISLDRGRLEILPVNEYVDLFVI